MLLNIIIIRNETKSHVSVTMLSVSVNLSWLRYMDEGVAQR